MARAAGSRGSASRADGMRVRASVRLSRVAAPVRTRARSSRAVRRARDRSVAIARASAEEGGEEEARRRAEEARRLEREDERRRAEGDARVRDELERELRLRGKIYRAEKELEAKKDEIVELGNASKSSIDAEAGVAKDRVSLELGMIAGELDAELAALADEAQAARERNARVKREIEDLADELLGRGRPGRRDEKPKPGSLADLKARAADAEADAVDKRMQATLEETQRATTYTMVLLLLSFLGVALLAEGSYDKFAAVAGAFALVAYQSRAELQAKSKGK